MVAVISPIQLGTDQANCIKYLRELQQFYTQDYTTQTGFIETEFVPPNGEKLVIRDLNDLKRIMDLFYSGKLDVKSDTKIDKNANLDLRSVPLDNPFRNNIDVAKMDDEEEKDKEQNQVLPGEEEVLRQKMEYINNLRENIASWEMTATQNASYLCNNQEPLKDQFEDIDLNVDFESELESLKVERLSLIMEHEQAHANVIGGTPVITYDSYGVAVGGYVEIEEPVLDKSNLDRTIEYSSLVIEAALAPTSPSDVDYEVARDAQYILNEATALKRAQDQGAQNTQLMISSLNL